MRIAVCDDEQQYIDTIYGIINSYARDKNRVFEISAFLSGTDLLAKCQASQFDIIFLDIMMPQINGLELAKQIRRADTDVQIVFITFMADEMPRGFDVMAAGFIVKPLTRSEIYHVLGRLIPIYERKHMAPYEVRFKGGQSGTLNLQEVLYLESRLHRVCAVTKTSECEYWGKLSEQAAQLSRYGFAQIHRSYLVNMAWVWIVTDEDVTFTNNKSLSFGTKYVNSFKETFRKYKRGDWV